MEEYDVEQSMTKLGLENALAVEWNVVNKLNLGFLEGIQHLQVIAVEESQQRQKVFFDVMAEDLHTEVGDADIPLVQNSQELKYLEQDRVQPGNIIQLLILG